MNGYELDKSGPNIICYADCVVLMFECENGLQMQCLNLINSVNFSV